MDLHQSWLRRILMSVSKLVRFFLWQSFFRIFSVRRTLLHSLLFRLLGTGPLSAQVMVSITARPTPSLWTTSIRTASVTTMMAVTPSKTDSPSLSVMAPTCSSSSKRVGKRSVNFLCYLSFSMYPVVINVIVIYVEGHISENLPQI